MNWYPGHMAKNWRQIKNLTHQIDLLLVVLDGRIPLSSFNPQFLELVNQVNYLLIVTKKDLSDEVRLKQIMTKYQNNYLLVNLKDHKSHRLIWKTIQKKTDKVQQKPLIKIFVLGIPNVGKSSLLNLLVKQKKASVANIPGHTRGRQMLSYQNYLLFDSPGLLWPKIEDHLQTIKLAFLGLISSKVINYQEVFFDSYKLLSKLYPQKIIELGLGVSENIREIEKNLTKYCQKRNFLSKNKQLDFKKAYRAWTLWGQKLKGITLD